MSKKTSKKKGRGNKKVANTEQDYEISGNEMTETTVSSWAADINVKNKFKLSNVHKDFYHKAICDNSKVLFADGPAGSAKTYMAVYAALTLLQQRKIDKIYYVRSAVESASKSLGFLPGEIGDKFGPWVVPLQEKIEELVTVPEAKKIVSSGLIEAVPINFWRGRTASSAVVIVDEAQNLTREECKTIITRIGDGTKYIFLGDILQSDIGHKSGFADFMNVFDDEESVEKGIYTFKFTEQEIVRSEILKFIIKKLEKQN